MRAHLLLVEHDAILGQQYSAALMYEFEVTWLRDAQAALDKLSDEGALPVLIVMDVLLGPHDGIELLHELRGFDAWAAIPIVLLSSVPSYRMPAIDVARYNIAASFYKPFCPPDRLRAYLNQHLMPGAI